MTRVGTVHNETCDLVELEVTLSKIKGSMSEPRQELSRDIDGDFELACGGPDTPYPPFYSLACNPTAHTSCAGPAVPFSMDPMSRLYTTRSAGSLSPEIVPYAVALMLEVSNCKWEHVKSWSTYLFGSNTDEFHGKWEVESMIRNENEQLIGTGGYVVGEGDKKRQLARRLILSNLAAGVDEESILVFLAKYRSNIRRVTLLSERDPVKGTRTVHVDMDSRRAAVYASFQHGHIFGLVVKTKLAVE
ncbi:hypothetical protein COCC4DRAFT_194240 [Bipolaris maydis ATCC 48331]|uniref:RRM domain-containing protein n=3 Tax=Cochliobolus heterostrophus TaxID=5016 RepID=M2UT98_COCH5|nr:uncharacterized protein COCC4DRAFT_194240 [Bipolaris maydis ATCC 48331]EMD91108.1 hypothetical protein COCHEDRAFT_1194810 [Bipolaris maydis C5]ENI05811.1 hypothetical protein COCC4DRAFT_194240 [Bipolaris maydis ATCC 48331]KAJ6205110.1 hypothetical protein PSV09DRAFT_1194810 [Bipolaris maydis]